MLDDGEEVEHRLECVGGPLDGDKFTDGELTSKVNMGKLSGGKYLFGRFNTEPIFTWVYE